MVQFIAYKVRNKIDNKGYVGITKQTLETRWTWHQRPESGCRYLRAAITVHGKDNFEIEHIASSWDEKNLKALERLLIVQEGTLAPNGYNLTEGGEGCFNPPPEVRAKIAKGGMGKTPWNKGLTHSAETLAKMSASHMGNQATLGHHLSDAHKAKLSASLKGRIMPPITDETRVKMSAAGKRRKRVPLSREHREAISRGLTGYKRPPMSDAEKLKRSIAMKKNITEHGYKRWGTKEAAE